MIFTWLAKNLFKKTNIYLRLVELRPPSGGIWVVGNDFEFPVLAPRFCVGYLQDCPRVCITGNGSKGRLQWPPGVGPMTGGFFSLMYAAKYRGRLGTAGR